MPIKLSIYLDKHVQLIHVNILQLHYASLEYSCNMNETQYRFLPSCSLSSNFYSPEETAFPAFNAALTSSFLSSGNKNNRVPYMRGTPCSKCRTGYNYCMDEALCARHDQCQNTGSRCRKCIRGHRTDFMRTP